MSPMNTTCRQNIIIRYIVSNLSQYFDIYKIEVTIITEMLWLIIPLAVVTNDIQIQIYTQIPSQKSLEYVVSNE